MQPIRFRKHAWIFVAVALTLICWSVPAPISRAETPIASTRSDRGAAADVDPGKLFDAVVDTIDRNFVDTDRLKALDWQARAKEIRPAVVSAATLDEAVGLIRKLLLELNLSHTELTTPDEFRYYVTLDAFSDYSDAAEFIRDKFWGSGGPYFPGIGIFTAEIEGRHFIDGVLEGSPADKAGLKFGDEIVSVDGKPYRPIAAFRGKIGATAEIEIRRTRGGEIKRYGVPVAPIVPSVAFSNATTASARVIEQGGRRIGYIHLWSLKEASTFRAALTSLDPQNASGRANAQGKPLDALIVDMRGRVGGNAMTASLVLDTIGVAQKPYWGERRSKIRPDARRTGTAVSTAFEPAQLFHGHSVLLVDHQTRSAGEVMALGYKRSLFGPVIGTRTAGAVAGGLVFPMPGGFLLLVAVDQVEYDGKSLEGVGVTPDVRVERPLSYAGGADPVLDAAVDHLAKGGLPHPMNGYGFTR